MPSRLLAPVRRATKRSPPSLCSHTPRWPAWVCSAALGSSKPLSLAGNCKRHLGHLAHGNARWHRVKRHLRQPLFRHRIGQRLHARHLAVKRFARA